MSADAAEAVSAARTDSTVCVFHVSETCMTVGLFLYQEGCQCVNGVKI